MLIYLLFPFFLQTIQSLTCSNETLNAFSTFKYLTTTSTTNQHMFRSFADLNEQFYLIAGKMILGSNNVPFLLKYEANLQILWAKAMDTSTNIGYFNDIISLQDGNFLIIGKTFDTHLIFAKIDANGNFFWKKKLQHASITEEGIFSYLTKNNEIIIFAKASSDIAIYKIDSNGNLLTTKLLQYAEYPKGLIELSNGDYLLFGETFTIELRTYSKTTPLIIRLNSNFDVISKIKFEINKFFNFGGSSDENIRNIAYELSDGSIIFIANVMWNIPYTNLFYFKIDSNFNLVWAKKIGSSTSSLFNHGFYQMPNGNFFVAGTTDHLNAGSDYYFFIAEVDINGNLIATKKLNPTNYLLTT